MVSSLNVTFNYVYMLNGHWPFGNIYCKVCSFISIISVCGSVFTLVAISTDRYDQFKHLPTESQELREERGLRTNWVKSWLDRRTIEGLIGLGKLQFSRRKLGSLPFRKRNCIRYLVDIQSSRANYRLSKSQNLTKSLLLDRLWPSQSALSISPCQSHPVNLTK